MPFRLASFPVAFAALLVGAPACVPDWDPPSGAICEGACSTTQGLTDSEMPTTGGLTPTSSAQDSGADITTDDPSETGGEPGTTTQAQPEGPPEVDGFEVKPPLTEGNGLIELDVSTKHADGVRMQLETGPEVELTPGQGGSFTGQIAAFTGLDNGDHIAVLTPWREGIDGVSVEAPYYIALDKPGSELLWDTGDQIGGGFVVAMDVLPDRRWVELGTYYPQGEPRCFVRVRDQDGKWTLDDVMDVLPGAYCTATDLTVDPDTGALHVLVDREGENGLRWWLGEISSWGKGAKQISVGSIGDKALALARHPNMLAVCGAKKVATADMLDAFAVLVRPGQDPEERVFDYKPIKPHFFTETARDCAFSDDTLVLVGEARSWDAFLQADRDRLALLEYDVLTSLETWTIAGASLGVQSRALTVAVDDQKRYHLVGYNCLVDCEPQGDLWGYLPGGTLFTHTPLGPLGSDALGPHDIAWSPAGYMIIAYGELAGQSSVFKVEAFAPGVPVPLWTFTPKDNKGPQIAFAVAVDRYGKVCAGGIAAGNPAFACSGS